MTVEAGSNPLRQITDHASTVDLIAAADLYSVENSTLLSRQAADPAGSNEYSYRKHQHVCHAPKKLQKHASLSQILLVTVAQATPSLYVKLLLLLPTKTNIFQASKPVLKVQPVNRATECACAAHAQPGALDHVVRRKDPMTGRPQRMALSLSSGGQQNNFLNI